MKVYQLRFFAERMHFVENNYTLHENHQKCVYNLTIVAICDVILYNDFDFGIICKRNSERKLLYFNRRNFL